MTPHQKMRRRELKRGEYDLQEKMFVFPPYLGSASLEGLKKDYEVYRIRRERGNVGFQNLVL